MVISSHSRNPAEKASILALAFRAGLFNEERGRKVFSVQPSNESFDRFGKFDLLIYKDKQKLRVDITSSYRYKGFKIQRAVRRARQGRRWIFVLKVDWNQAAFIGIDPCFNRAWDQIQDGVPIALTEVCPVHGNSCEFAQKLLGYSRELNAIFENETTL